MKTKTIPHFLTLILGTGLAALACSMSAFAADHPRLLLGKNEVPALREKVKKEPFASMLARMTAPTVMWANN